MAVSKIANMINPQVMSDMVGAKLNAALKATRYAKIDNTLEGVAGDTITVPSWNYVGDAATVTEGTTCAATTMSAGSTTVKIKKAMINITLTDEAMLAGLGDPVGQAETQIGMSLKAAIENDVIAAAQGSSKVYGDGTAAISYSGLVDAVALLDDENDNEKVIFIAPAQRTALLKDPNFLSADKFTSGVAVKGSIGMVAGMWVKVSKRIVKDGTFYLNPILTIGANDADSEFDDNELAGVTVYMKRDALIEDHRTPENQTTSITGSIYYGVGLTNASKVCVGKFKA